MKWIAAAMRVADVTFIYQVVAGSAPFSDVSSITFGDFSSASLQGADSSLLCTNCTPSLPNFGSTRDSVILGGSFSSSCGCKYDPCGQLFDG
jgi:hypothetical protein